MVVVWWWCGGGGGVVYLTDYRTTPGCSTLLYSVQLWIVAIIRDNLYTQENVSYNFILAQANITDNMTVPNHLVDANSKTMRH